MTYTEIHVCVCVCVTDNIEDLRFSTWNAPQTSGILNCKRSKSEEICSMYKSRRANQSILKEISPEYSLEGLMLKLKLQYFGYLMQSVDSLEKTLKVIKMECGRGRG